MRMAIPVIPVTRKLTAIAFLFLMLMKTALAQGLPQTDLWLASINSDSSGLVIGEPEKINISVGYNNQPHFSVDGVFVYYTREMPGEDGVAQTDIAAFNLETRATTMVAQTALSEYSPTPVPGRNALSVIQVEPDERQRLWAINISNGEMDLLLPDVEPVGYHAWYTDHKVAMFILGESFTLHTSELGVNGSVEIADNIGRTIRKHPETSEILFVDKNSVPWQIAAFSPAENRVRSIMPLFPAGEDFTVDNNGNYWTGNGSRLYRRSGDDKRWELMADFSAIGIRNISRLAVDSTHSKIVITSDHVESK